ncbi:hypothetical protein K1T71_005378 [Dendrolimus kikuchii]|uniref:Uncharacterized protein n=1 Tax=Dendrolimus kikuchii TaxID=765133 RepID=A0ACC1D4T8_9NEOP|nr:hypothetical protein K1T71_005378 [Dendrolimus kikuchii]
MSEELKLEKDERPSSDFSVKRRKKGMRKNLSNLLNEYSKSSTLHGLRYVSERQLTIYEKAFWLITFLVSVTICVVVIVNLYIKWKSNPVIVTINENIISASKIPFPSITICPQSKCKASVFNYSAARSALASHYFRGSKVSHNHYEVFFRCIWRGRKTSDCGYLFKYVLTREGVCFNMNTIAASKLLNLNRTSLHQFCCLPSFCVRRRPMHSRVRAAILSCYCLSTFNDIAPCAHLRQCYFEGEKSLKYFSTYTAHNCWLECLSNYTFMKCGCVGFYMPHELAELEASGNTSFGCRCLPACNTIDYTAEASVSDFDYKTLWEIEYQGTFDNSSKYSRIVMFFQQPGFIAMRRSKLFGWIDFIANCGGLLGLFLGFSVLSIVEIMYYVTIRLWCSSEQGPKKNKKKPKQIFTIKT